MKQTKKQKINKEERCHSFVKSLVLESYDCIPNESGKIDMMWDFLFKKVMKLRLDRASKQKLFYLDQGLYNIKRHDKLSQI